MGHQRLVLGCGGILVAGLVGFILAVPVVSFDRPFATVLFDREGELLAVGLAADEQLRLAPVAKVPETYARAAIHFEDRRFFWHPGVDPIAVVRAGWQNFLAGEVVSGASTLTMQTVRLARAPRPRTVWEKLREVVLAMRLEVSLSKAEILALYASHAPFGGNVVGLEAASRFYFRRPPGALSWGEAATLAVLPNQPGLVRPDRNRERLRARRDHLLDSLHEAGHIDTTVLHLAKAEPLLPEPVPLPRHAPHLWQRFQNAAARERVHERFTTIDGRLQRNVERLVDRHHRAWLGNGVHNAAALIADVQSGHVLAYVGNAGAFGDSSHHGYVDVVRAPRSTGSLLKPFLYAAMLDAGELLPEQLVADIPTSIDGFSPENFTRTFDGAVPASQALARSLNVPAVRLLRAYGVDRFYGLLKDWGLSTLHRPASEYGLTLILGGAEGTLWDLSAMYARLARAAKGDRSKGPPLRVEAGWRPGAADGYTPSPGAAFATLAAMLKVSRPGSDGAWRAFANSRRVAWKTGTSFGFRDGWAVGVTPRYVVGVWFGNADGEPRPRLTGYYAAAPLLFDLFELLPSGKWFTRPAKMKELEVCRHSGMRAGLFCPHTTMAWIPTAARRSAPCVFCQRVHCDAGCVHRVHSRCERLARMTVEKRFVLPPAMEAFYVARHGNYRRLPPWRADCRTPSDAAPAMMTFLYPPRGAEIYVPIELAGQRGRVVFRAAHRRPEAIIHWHLDQDYIATTEILHEVAVAPAAGPHRLTLVDDDGEHLERAFVAFD